MLAAIRAFAKSWVAAVLMGLLIVSFALWGIRDVFRGRISDAVIVAGSRTISSVDYRREFDQQKSALEQRFNQQIPTDVAVANGFDQQVLQALASREAFAELMRKIGLQPSDKLVVSELQKIPAFFDPVSGRFDEKSYQQRLAENGMTPAIFERLLRDEVAQQQFGTGLAGGLTTPRAYTALAAIYGLEDRDLSEIVVTPQSVPRPPAPTDAQLTAFMKENAAQLTLPEFRSFSLVRFSPDQANVSGPVDEAEVKKRYDFRKDTLSKPETRSIVQIPVKDQAAAQKVVSQLGKGDPAQAVAKSIGAAAIDYPDKPQSAIPDRKVGAAAFAMKAGETKVVQGDLGLAVVHVETITPGHTVTLEEIRPALEAEVRKDAAIAKVDALSQAYDDAHTKGATLAEAAKQAGVPVVTIPPVAKQGLDRKGQPVPGVTQKILETAFSLPAGGESELVDAGDNQYFAVRVDKIIPPAMPPLAEIRPELAQEWTLREVASRMEAKAKELAERVKKGESLDAVARSAGLKVAHLTGLNRQSAAQSPAGQDVLAQAFNGKVGDVFTARDRQFGYVVGKLDAIRQGDPTTLARVAEQVRPSMTQAYLQELDAAARAAARKEVKVRIYPAQARAALGLEPETAKTEGKPGLVK